MALLAFLAARVLLRSRLTTLLLILAVTAGVGMQIPNTANLLGYSDTMFEEATTRGFGDVRIESTREPIFDDGDAVAAKLAAVSGVRAAVPIITLPAGLEVHGKQIVSELHGIDPKSAWKPYRIRDGSDLDDEGVLVGTGIAAKHGIKPGESVQVHVILPGASSIAELTLPVRGTAAGTFGAHVSLFVTRAFLARLIARPHAATRVLLYAGLHVGSRGLPNEAEKLARAAALRTPEMTAVTWMQEEPLVESAFEGNQVLAVVSHAMVLIAVTIPVGALLYVTVETRRREIAMLSALGFARSDIFVAFVLQSLGIGITGSLLGCGVGAAALAWFSDHPIFQSADFVIRPVVSSASFYEPVLVIVITTVLAALYPAWRASRVAPARVLRSAE
jgi:ABC-type lipoprotein release transport system permease subunit